MFVVHMIDPKTRVVKSSWVVQSSCIEIARYKMAMYINTWDADADIRNHEMSVEPVEYSAKDIFEV